jgi:hypothetical protein
MDSALAIAKGQAAEIFQIEKISGLDRITLYMGDRRTNRAGSPQPRGVSMGKRRMPTSGFAPISRPIAHDFAMQPSPRESRSKHQMSAQSSLTGRWVGDYEQRGQKRPITALLVQEGPDLTGSMQDGQPDTELSVFEATVEAGLPPGSDEQIEANLRAVIPGGATATIRCVSHLPADSQLQGRRDGPVVSFVKTYMGSSFSGYKVGDELVGTRNEGHAVRYQGRLSPDGTEIEGRWWIDADPSRGIRRSEGFFTLLRDG